MCVSACDRVASGRRSPSPGARSWHGRRLVHLINRHSASIKPYNVLSSDAKVIAVTCDVTARPKLCYTVRYPPTHAQQADVDARRRGPGCVGHGAAAAGPTRLRQLPVRVPCAGQPVRHHRTTGGCARRGVCYGGARVVEGTCVVEGMWGREQLYGVLCVRVWGLGNRAIARFHQHAFTSTRMHARTHAPRRSQTLRRALTSRPSSA